MSFRLSTALVAIIAVVVLRYIWARQSYRARLPPGPMQLPLVGNLFNFPVARTWPTFVEWSHVWGDLMSIWIFGRTLIIVNSEQAASDLLEKRGTMFTEPAKLIFSGELAGYDILLAFSSYERSRPLRRMIHGSLGSRSLVSKLHPVQERWAKRFLQRVLNTPEDFAQHIEWMTGAIILEVTYGYHVKDKGDPFVEIVNRSGVEFVKSIRPGGYLVDTFQFLRHVPGWVPGFGFQYEAARYRKSLAEVIEQPYQYVKDQMMSGCAKPSFVSKILEEERTGLSAEKELLLKCAAASMYAGGADTSQVAMSSFFLVMALYPEIQGKAREEIDRVVGTSRLPCLADMPDLPYLSAILSEILRWNPIAPVLLHTGQEEDTYRGYLIPKGSLVMVNLWGILHDPQLYDDPMTFNPERFIAKPDREPETDPRRFVFGMGRRSCPGMHLAEANTFIVCAMSLSMFNISNAVNENGGPVDPTVAYTHASISRPKPFMCSIRPRSDKTKDLILSLVVESS